MRRAIPKLDSKGLKALNDELRQEMEEIRSSAEDELLKAWAEVEELYDEKEELLEFNGRLVLQLQLAREREESLLTQLRNIQSIDSETGNRRINNNHNSKGPIVNFLSSLAVKDKILRSSSERTIDTANTTVSEISESLEESLRIEQSNFGIFGFSPIEESSCSKRERVEKEKQELFSEFQCKLKCREIVLDSLEQTSIQQEENLKNLRIKIIEQNADARSREQAQRQQMTKLNDKIKEKGKVITKQEQRIKKYRDYIEYLSSELRRVVTEQKLLSSDPNETRGKFVLTTDTVKLQTELSANT